MWTRTSCWRSMGMFSHLLTSQFCVLVTGPWCLQWSNLKCSKKESLWWDNGLNPCDRRAFLQNTARLQCTESVLQNDAIAKMVMISYYYKHGGHQGPSGANRSSLGMNCGAFHHLQGSCVEGEGRGEDLQLGRSPGTPKGKMWKNTLLHPHWPNTQLQGLFSHSAQRICLRASGALLTIKGP